MLIFKSRVQIITLSLNPIEPAGLSHNSKERYMKGNIRFSVFIAMAHSLISCPTEYFTRSRTLE